MAVYFAATLIMLLNLSFKASAQNGTIRGTVTGRDSALTGASVTVGQTGALTDNEGRFVLSVPAGRQTLTVNFVGFSPLQKLFCYRK